MSDCDQVCEWCEEGIEWDNLIEEINHPWVILKRYWTGEWLPMYYCSSTCRNNSGREYKKEGIEIKIVKKIK